MKKSEANALIREGEYLVKNGKRVHHPSSRRVASHSVRNKGKKAKPAHSHRASPKKFSKKVSKAKSIHPGRRVAGKSSRRPSKHTTAKPSRSRKPERRHAGQSKKRKFPVARETPNERDMPFVSIPHRRVGHSDKTIVMEDPAIKAPLPKPRHVGAAIKPDQKMLDPDADGPPSEVGEAKAAAMPPPAAQTEFAPSESAPATVGPAPASVGGAPVVEAPAAVEQSAEAQTAHAAAESATREPDAFDLHSGQDPMRGP